MDDDWIQRAQGDLVTRPVVMWTAGLYDELPEFIDHTIVDIATGLGRNGWGAALLMRDVSGCMVSVEKGTIPLDQHARFIDHMAKLHAHFWGFRDTYGLMPRGNLYLMFSSLMTDYEAGHGGPGGVPDMAGAGWERMADLAPGLAEIVFPLLRDPWPLVDAQAAGPQTLVHSDWKAGNLGSHDDGRTILLDWAFPSEAPGTADLGWYLAVNCDLLPHSKEETIALYKESLEREGIQTTGWWEAQLELALLAQVVLLGWSKTGDELAWWEERVPRALRFL
ncbi:MAG TPA: aminoglycoside phosphotransferase [Actinomycetota bacterium]|nr:aminoglycoside phosphotransferase [Actinomycetota bacterium]